jgi:hypothetical protein
MAGGTSLWGNELLFNLVPELCTFNAAARSTRCVVPKVLFLLS